MENLIKDWTEGMAPGRPVVSEVRDEAGRRFLDWTRPELDGWMPPIEVPPACASAPSRSTSTIFPMDRRATRGSNRCRPTSSCRPSCRSRFRGRS